MKHKRVIYTCITNRYDILLNPICYDPNWNYVCFTDDPKLANKTNSIWEFKPLQFNTLDPIRNQRWHKLHPHKLFPDHEISLWRDANVYFQDDLVFNDVKKVLASKKKLAVAAHPERDCLYDESDSCITLEKDDKTLILQSAQLIREEQFPAHAGLFETNIMFRHHHEKRVIAVMQDWWDWIKRYSYRDQLSFSYILWKHEFECIPLRSESYRYLPKSVSFIGHGSDQISVIFNQAFMNQTYTKLNFDLTNIIRSFKASKTFKVLHLSSTLKSKISSILT